MEHLMSYNDKLSKAFKLVLSGKVKLHKFLPSNRIIYTRNNTFKIKLNMKIYFIKNL